jgi:uncharacterized protein YqgV (UPF0045/DUF77 family)
MKLTAELSLYPLQENYIPVIEKFINAVRAHSDLDVVGNAMSTQIYGDSDRVFNVVRSALETSHQQFGRQVLVAKFITGEFDLHS